MPIVEEAIVEKKVSSFRLPLILVNCCKKMLLKFKPKIPKLPAEFTYRVNLSGIFFHSPST